MKTSGSIESIIKLEKDKVKIGGNGRVERDSKYEFGDGEFVSNEVDGSIIKNNKVAEEKNYQKTSKFKKLVRSSDFFISRTRLAFIKLKQIFVKTSILYYFDPKSYNWIKIDILSSIIGRVFSQLTLDNLG